LESVKTSAISRETSDEKLVSMAISGNALAFRMLVDRHHHYVTSIASRFLFKEDDTHEVVQDTFVRVWKHLENYDGKRLFTTWLYAIAFNLCLDKLRINRRRREVSLTEDDMGKYFGETDSGDPVKKMDTASIVRAIREYAGKLSLVQRQVFVLRDLQDLSVDDVCSITGYDADKVKSNLYHARKFMREKLVKGGYL